MRYRSLVRRVVAGAGLSMLGSALGAFAAGAQVSATVDLGAASTDRSARTSSPVLFRGLLRWRSEHASIEALAMSAPSSPSPGGLYGIVRGELRTSPVWGQWRLGLDALSGRGRRPTIFNEDRLDLAVGPVLDHPEWQISTQYGVTRLVDWERRIVRRAEMSVRRELGAGYVAIAGRRTTFPDTITVQRDTTYVVAGFPFTGQRIEFGHRRRSYFDGEVELARVVGPTFVQLRSGMRFQMPGDAGRPWGSLQVTAPIRAGIALVASTGWTPAYPEQYRPRSWYASAGFRVLDVASLFGRRPADNQPQLVVVTSREGRRVLRLTGVEGRRVELSGDFTDWEPVDLARGESGAWERPLALGPGTYRVMLRVDGLAWHAPPGLPVVPDEYGGDVGVLVVE